MLLHLLFSCLCMVTFFSHSAKAKDKQYLEDSLQSLCAPVEPTAAGFAHFLKNSYNEPHYAQDFLPNNFAHALQFLAHGKQHQQTRSYAQSVLRLFANKLKGCEYVNAHALSELLAQLPHLLEQHFLVQRTPDINLLQTKINQLLYAKFLDKFTDFKSNPTSFFDDLTQDILEALTVHSSDNGDVSMEELRKTVVIFCEIALGKLIWSPDDTIDTWHSVKKISQQLAVLMDYNIISDPDDLNDLFVTLIERYCFFIDLAGHGLPAQFYLQLNHELEQPTTLLLTLEEQEDYLESKAERLARALHGAQKKFSADAAPAVVNSNRG